MSARRRSTAALKAVPLSSGRGGNARRRVTHVGDDGGSGGESITQRGLIFEEAGRYKGETSEGLALSGERTPLSSLTRR
jgi:hypothetical protein